MYLWISSQIMWLSGKQHPIWEQPMKELISTSAVSVLAPCWCREWLPAKRRLNPSSRDFLSSCCKQDGSTRLFVGSNTTSSCWAGNFLVTPPLHSHFLNQHLPVNKPSLTRKALEKSNRKARWLPSYLSVGVASDKEAWKVVMAKKIRALNWQNFISFFFFLVLLQAKPSRSASHYYIICVHILMHDPLCASTWGAHLSLCQQKTSHPLGDCCMQTVFSVISQISQKAHAISTITPILQRA